MYIIKDKQTIADNIFNGRNSEWFDNLQGRGWDSEYDHLDIQPGLPAETPDKLITKSSNDFYYGHNSFKVSDFLDWFREYRPDKDAGWFTTYDKWRMENKGYVPTDPQHYLSEDDNINDMHFIEFINKYDCSAWLFDYLIKNEIDLDAWVIYWFDC